MLVKLVLKLLQKLTNREILTFSDFDPSKDFKTWLIKIDKKYFESIITELNSWKNITKNLDIYLQTYSIQGGLEIDYKGIKNNNIKSYILAFIQIMTLHGVFNPKNFDLMCKDLFDEEIELLDNTLRGTKDRLKDEITLKFQEVILGNKNYISKLAKKIDNLEKHEKEILKLNEKSILKLNLEKQEVLKKERIIKEQREFIREIEVLKKLEKINVEDKKYNEKEIKKKLNLEQQNYKKLEYDYFLLNTNHGKLNNNYIELQDFTKELKKKLQRSENNTMEYREAYNKIKNTNEKLIDLQEELKKKSLLSKEVTLLKNSLKHKNKTLSNLKSKITDLEKENKLCKKTFTKLESKNNIIINKINDIKKKNLVLKEYNKNLMNRLYLYEKTVMKIDKKNIRNFRKSWNSNEIIKDLKSFDYKIQFKEKDEENELLKSQVHDLVLKKNSDTEVINLLDQIEEKNNMIKNLENNLENFKIEAIEKTKEISNSKFGKLEEKIKKCNYEIFELRKKNREYEDRDKYFNEQISLKDNQLKDFTVQIEDLQKKILINK